MSYSFNYAMKRFKSENLISCMLRHCLQVLLPCLGTNRPPVPSSRKLNSQFPVLFFTCLCYVFSVIYGLLFSVIYHGLCFHTVYFSSVTSVTL